MAVGKVAPRSVNYMDVLKQFFYKLQFTGAMQQAFLEDLATLVEDGVPANKAVDVIYQVEEGVKQKVAQSIRQKIAQGRPIAEGMAGWFPIYVTELIRAGESGGTLTQNIRSAALSLGQKTETIASLASSLTYPLVVIVSGCGVAVYLNHSVFNQFMAIKPLSQWPPSGQELVAFARVIQDGWWLIVSMIFAAGFGISRLLTSYVGVFRPTIDTFPGANVYREVKAARFMETLGLLVSNGVSFKHALQIMLTESSPYVASHLLLMERKLARGRSNIADVLDTGMVNREDVVRLRAIADSKGFEHALIRLGRQAAENSVKTLKKFGKILGGILLAVAAGLAIFMVMGIYTVGSSLA